jgi:stage II sporulation protein D
MVELRVYDPANSEFFYKPLEDLVKMVLPLEIQMDCHIESLKAQAVIIRTNMLYSSRIMGGRGCQKYKGADLCRSDHCYNFYYTDELKDVWKESYEEYLNKLNLCVDETKDIVICRNDKPIMAEYHHTCGGSTENSENLIHNSVTYLRMVLCEYCQNSPYWECYKDFSLEEIEEKLNTKFPQPKPDLDVEFTGFIDSIERDNSGRVKSANIGGEKFDGKEIMDLLELNSTRFGVSPILWRFSTRGKGYGLGYCQYGGNEMANRGFSFKEILNYYYTGVDIKELSLPSIEKPLLGKTLVIDPGHGGEDFGNVGQSGLKEKDINFKVSLEMKKILEETGCKVYLTRDDDKEVLLTKRCEIANTIHPDFFISIHMNFFPNSNKKGCTIYHYRKDDEGIELGRNIQNSLNDKVDIPPRGINEGDFFLLKFIKVSSIIIELDYLSNPIAEKKFSDGNHIKTVAKSIVEGIMQYFKY